MSPAPVKALCHCGLKDRHRGKHLGQWGGPGWTCPHCALENYAKEETCRCGFSSITGCVFCGAPDNRAPDHARGCPCLDPPTREELYSTARAVEAGWAAS